MSDDQLIETEISDEAIYEGRVVNLHIKQVRLPNGQSAKREIILHSGAVAVVPLLPDGQVMLVRQYRKAADRVLLEVPAGTLDHHGEAPEAAAIRELREEIGYRANQLTSLGGIFVAPGYSTEYIHLYLAQDLVHDPLAADSDEFIHTVTMPLTEALAKIMNGEIEDAKTISSLLITAHRFS